MKTVEQLADQVGTAPACEALGVARASVYRKRKRDSVDSKQKSSFITRVNSRRLSDQERLCVLSILNDPRFVDQAPEQIYAILLDEGQYLCSARTMYRILAEQDQVRERRNQLRHPKYKKPQLLAEKPNQVWTWDITKLKGSTKWTYYYLYVILDLFSRYVAGWMIAHHENANLSQRLISQTCIKQNVSSGQLTIHSDRGAPMTSKTVSQLLVDLEIEKSHSRPRVSNDNPFSESQFKTMKYHSTFPGRFETYDQSKDFCHHFFDWYNQQHRHSGIGYMTPEAVHYGQSSLILSSRQSVLSKAYQKHPNRFVQKQPIPPKLPQTVWINPPEDRKVVVQTNTPGNQKNGSSSKVLKPFRAAASPAAKVWGLGQSPEAKRKQPSENLTPMKTTCLIH